MVVFDFSLVLFDDMLYYNKVYERDVVDMIDNNTQFFRTHDGMNSITASRSF